MGSTFGSLSTALSSLYAQRRGLDVTGQNIANANTDGYSRQRVNMQSVGASVVPAMYARADTAAGGVTVSGLDRLRDGFLELRGQAEHGKQSMLTTDQATLQAVEKVYTEPSDTGLQSQLSDLWAGFHDVANNAGDSAARNQLLQRASTLVGSLHSARGDLTSQWTSSREQLGTLVSEVNSTAANVADLNQAIVRATQSNLPANDLMDQRDLAVMHLAEIAGVTTRQGDSGSVDVFLGGTALVRQNLASQLRIDGATEFEGVATDPVTMRWVDGGTYPASLDSGSAGSLIGALNGTLPKAVDDLDRFAQVFATAVNDQHGVGSYDLYGNVGVPMFKASVGSVITAESITMAFTDPKLVAASSIAPSGTPLVANLDGGNATKLAHLASARDGPDAMYRQLVVQLGVQVQAVNRNADIQTSVAAQVDSLRDASAGVNIDEEMINMLAYQRAYEGASRLLTTIDSTLDTLINRMGA